MTKKKASLATKLEHPSYSNPTISEALCDIHFSLGANLTWKPALFGEFFREIQDDFPEMDPVLDVGYQVEFGLQAVGRSLMAPRQRFKFKHRTKPLLLQLSESAFTVNVLPTYPGWHTMRRDVLDAWSRARTVLKPTCVTRVGLRYINRIDRQTATETPGDWLKSGEFIASGVLRSKGAFLSRVESYLDSFDRLVVTVAEIHSDSESNPRPIVFDIDRIAERPLAVTDDKLQTELDRLHEEIWRVFDSAKTTKLDKWLKRGAG